MEPGRPQQQRLSPAALPMAADRTNVGQGIGHRAGDQSTARLRDRRAANRHSRLVRIIKIVLPIIVLIVAGMIVSRLWLFSYLTGIKMPEVLFTKNGLTMVEPHLTGRSRDRAYDIAAVRATQDFASPKVFNLEQLAGRVEMKDNGWAKISARTGSYDANGDRLKLNGAVTVTTSTGYLLNAEDADIDLTKGNMATDNPVHIQGPTGWIDAGAARVTDSGAGIHFSRHVHLNIKPAVVPQTVGTDQPPGTGTTP